MLKAKAARTSAGHRLLKSDVPLLGSPLSVMEILMFAIPGMQKYEDGLSDQWQSRVHRDEWRRMLRLIRDLVEHDGQDLTSIPGETHLATRAVMDLGQGRHLNQLVASGVAHRARSKGWAWFLDALPKVSGRGIVVVVPALWQARICRLLKVPLSASTCISTRRSASLAALANGTRRSRS